MSLRTSAPADETASASVALGEPPAPVQFGRSDPVCRCPAASVDNPASTTSRGLRPVQRQRPQHARRRRQRGRRQQHSVDTSFPGAQSSCSNQIHRPGSPHRAIPAVTAARTASPKPVVPGHREHTVDHVSRVRQQFRCAVNRSRCPPRARDAGSRWTTAATRDNASRSQGSPSWHTNTASTGSVRARKGIGV